MAYLDTSQPHDHAPMVCRDCQKIQRHCVCVPLGVKVEYFECASCRAEKAYQASLRMLEANRKLKELGISINQDDDES